MKQPPPKFQINPDYVKCGFCNEAILKFGFKHLSIGCIICDDCIRNATITDVQKAVEKHSKILLTKKSIYSTIKEITTWK